MFALLYVEMTPKKKGKKRPVNSDDSAESNVIVIKKRIRSKLLDAKISENSGDSSSDSMRKRPSKKR